MRICGIACVKDSHEILLASIMHLALNRIADFYLYDHGSDPDLATFLANEFNSDAVRLHIIQKETPQFFQRAMVAALAELARADGFEVAVAFDADEFWCSTVEGHTLADQLAMEMPAGFDALRVPVVNYVQHCDVDAFHQDSLLTCRYSVVPHVDPTCPPRDLVDAGMPFVAMPFPPKVIAGLSSDTRFTEGQHGITKARGDGRIADALGIVVRHLSLPSRDELAGKREQGRRRVAAGFPPEIGWQVQRLATMTDGELDAYWSNNSWHLSDDQSALVGAYDRLVEDDALVQIGHELSYAADRFRTRQGAGVSRTTPSGGVPAPRLERLVQSLVDDLGMAELVHDERSAALHKELDERTAWALDLAEQVRDRDERLMGLAKEFDERSAWALRLSNRLAEADRELAGIKHSRIWRAARALHLAPQPRTSAGS
jgi:hypothetical protein